MEGDAQGRGRWVTSSPPTTQDSSISDIVITISFTLGIERLHYEDSIDKPTRTLTLTTPVPTGGKTQWCTGLLLMNFKGATSH
jgi:hypothetical protein